MTTRIRRAALYAKVWEKPVLKVAQEMGISDVALHKICRKHDIPVPPRGYWAKLAAGKRVRLADLPDADIRSDEWISIIGPRTGALSKSVQDALMEGKAIEKAKSGNTTVPPTPHILQLKADLDSAKPRKDGFIRFSGRKKFSVSVTPECKDRAYLVVSRIAEAAQLRGIAFVSSDDGLAFQIDEDQISLSVTEPLKKVPHVPTAREQVLLDKWDETCKRKKARGEWISKWERPNVPETDEVHSGTLLVEVDKANHYDGLRRRFGDGRRQRVENMSESIVTAAAACAAAASQRRVDEIRRQREYEEAKRRRAEAERILTLEKKRVELLDIVMKRLAKADQLDMLVANYRSVFGGEPLPDSCQRFLAWVSAKASNERDRVLPAKLAETIDHYELMDDRTKISSWTDIKLEPSRRY